MNTYKNFKVLFTVLLMSFIYAQSVFANDRFIGEGEEYDLSVEVSTNADATAYISNRMTNEPLSDVTIVFEHSTDDSTIAFAPSENPGILTAKIKSDVLNDGILLIDNGSGEPEIIELNRKENSTTANESRKENNNSVSAYSLSELIPLVFVFILGLLISRVVTLIKDRKIQEQQHQSDDLNQQPASNTATKDNFGNVAAFLLTVSLALAASPKAVFAGAGHSHAEGGNDGHGMGVASVEVTKKSQFILGIRTEQISKKPHQARSHRIGTTIARHQDSVAVQSSVTGFLKMTAKANIGTKLKANDVIGYIQGVGKVAIRSPIDGLVLRIHATNGQRVTAGQTIIQVINPKKLWIEAQLFEKDIENLVYGSPVEVIVGNKMKIQSILINQLPSIDSTSGIVKVYLEVDNSEGRLPIGASANVFLPKSNEAEGFAVPARSLMNLGGTSVVFVKTGAETFAHKTVKAGNSLAGDYVLIQEGLSEGDIVVTDGNYQLLTASN